MHNFVRTLLSSASSPLPRVIGLETVLATYRPGDSLATRLSMTYDFSAGMEGTFPSVAIVEARAMPLPTTTSITVLSSPSYQVSSTRLLLALQQNVVLLSRRQFSINPSIIVCMIARVCLKGPEAFNQCSPSTDILDASGIPDELRVSVLMGHRLL